ICDQAFDFRYLQSELNFDHDRFIFTTSGNDFIEPSLFLKSGSDIIFQGIFKNPKTLKSVDFPLAFAPTKNAREDKLESRLDSEYMGCCIYSGALA
ncbi:MAG: hypothetical protein ACRERU_17640, partial [Methylococcales bacterium]